MRMLIRDSNDGILVPIPQYPLYSALITLSGGKMVPYYLNEEDNWSLNAKEIEQNIIKSKNDGITVRAITVINPGNPTGQILTKECLQDIIKVCHEHNVLIMADEVY